MFNNVNDTRNEAFRPNTWLFIAVILCVLVLPACLIPANAWAVDEELLEGTNVSAEVFDGMSLADLKTLVEEKTEELAAKKERVVQIDKEMADNEKKLAQLEREIPAEEVRASHAVRESYKVQQNRADLTEMLLSSVDLDTFIDSMKYIDEVSHAHIDTLVDLRTQRDECEKKKVSLEQEKEQLKDDIVRTHDMMIAATIARNEEQRKADLASSGKDSLIPDHADWDLSEDDFVAVWAPRINRYYKGTAMAGTGELFAHAAYVNHIDPRWSPAISCIESGKGKICIKPHNAWGWGAVDSDPAGNAASWDSWESAINAHVKGLATGYGYSVTPEKAKTYCPPNWERWYSFVVSEMNSI